MDPEPIISLIKETLTAQGYDLTYRKGIAPSDSDAMARNFVNVIDEIIDDRGIPHGPKGLAKILEDDYDITYDKDHCFLQAANKAFKEYSSRRSKEEAAIRVLKEEATERVAMINKIIASPHPLTDEEDNSSEYEYESEYSTESDDLTTVKKVEPKKVAKKVAKKVEPKKVAKKVVAKKVVVKKVVKVEGR